VPAKIDQLGTEQLCYSDGYHRDNITFVFGQSNQKIIFKRVVKPANKVKPVQERALQVRMTKIQLWSVNPLRKPVIVIEFT
jgi:hypothetical protein